MAKHYSANQFEGAFVPSMIGNYEIPKYFCDWPKTRIGITEIIANKRGHVLPGVPKPKHNSPWGDFIGTWHMPKHLDRKTCDILNGSTAARIATRECKEKAKLRARQLKIMEMERSARNRKAVIKIIKEKEKLLMEKDINDLCPIHDLHIEYS